MTVEHTSDYRLSSTRARILRSIRLLRLAAAIAYQRQIWTAGELAAGPNTRFAWGTRVAPRELAPELNRREMRRYPGDYTEVAK